MWVERILLGWWVWAFLAIIVNAGPPDFALRYIILAPIRFVLSLFLDADAVSTGIGMFISFSWFALVAGGVMNSVRRRKARKTA